MAEELVEHWIWCNVYTKTVRNVTNTLLSLYGDFKKMQGCPKARQTEKWVKEKVEPYLETLEAGMDIRTMDVAFRKKQEDLYGVKETPDEESFWSDQISGQRVGFCDGFVDRKWQAQANRRTRAKEVMERMREKSEQEKRKMEERMEVPEEFDDNQNTADFEDKNYELQDEDKNPAKRGRVLISSGSKSNTGCLPPNYRHIRTSVKSVRPEYYTAIDRCISELHMSKEQSIGSTIIFAKELFNLRWKTSEEDDCVVDLDTVPDKRAIRKMGNAREVLALASLVEKIMSSEDRTTIVYHDDGSKKQGAGSFSVQGVTVDKKWYPFPTLSISSETRENLSQLKLTILNILSAVSGVSSKDLWHRIDFTMTDSTIHNMGVDNLVSEALETDHVPSHLLCQVHPACMFTRCLQKLCKQIDTTIGPSKIFSVFAVPLSDVQESVLEQWINCLTRSVTFTNHTSSHNNLQYF